jgi:hypothetical protein
MVGRDGSDIPLQLEAVAGCYVNPGLLATALRLTLGTDRSYILERWLDLGGRWSPLRSGTFVLDGRTVKTELRDVPWCPGSFGQDGVLHVRDIRLRVTPDLPGASRLVLIPADCVGALDEAVWANAVALEGLEESTFGSNCFFPCR